MFAYLPHRILIFRAVISKDKFGAIEKSWQMVYTCRAKVKPVYAKENETAYMTTNTDKFKVDVRQPPKSFTFSPNDRVVYTDRGHDIVKGKFFEITGIIDTREEHRGLTLECIEHVEDQNYA